MVMGGRLFYSERLDNIRMDQTTYNNVVSFLTSKLTEYNISHKVVPYITEKNTFGDIDIIIEPVSIDVLRKVVGEFVPYSRNSNIHSFLFQHKYQVDFIFSEKNKFNMTSFFYGYNDFAWMIAKLLEKGNAYKLYENGLYYIYHSNYKNHNILLTDNPDLILEVCQLNPSRYKEGFTTYTDMFDYIGECPILGSSLYALESMSHNNRKIYKNRTTYKKFSKWMDKHNVPVTSYGKLISPNIKFNNIVNQSINEIDSQYEKNKTFKQSFNGNLVSNLTGLKHHELGKFMAYIRKKYTDEQLIENAATIILQEFNEGNM